MEHPCYQVGLQPYIAPPFSPIMWGCSFIVPLFPNYINDFSCSILLLPVKMVMHVMMVMNIVSIYIIKFLRDGNFVDSNITTCPSSVLIFWAHHSRDQPLYVWNDPSCSTFYLFFSLEGTQLDVSIHMHAYKNLCTYMVLIINNCTKAHTCSYSVCRHRSMTAGQ